MEKRTLGVDLGSRRVGLAVTDPLNILVQRFKTIEYKNSKQLLGELKSVISEKNIGTIVFGLPLTLSGKESKKTTSVIELVELLKKELPNDLIVEFEDESLTTVEAHEIMHKLGKKPSKNRELVDQIAAQLILESYRRRTNRLL